jgi:membrane dipeptidase
MKCMTRRHFLGRLSAIGAGLVPLPTLTALLGCASTPRGIPPPDAERRVFADLHVHPTLNQWMASSSLAVQSPLLRKAIQTEFNVTNVRWRTLHEARVDLICAVHFNLFDEWLSMPTDPNPEAPANTIRMLDMLERELEGPAAPYAKLARNRDELQTILALPKNNEDYRIAVLHSIEGGHALAGQLSPLEQFARRGVVSITITHFFNKGIASAPNSYPFFPDMNALWPAQGLSPFGKDVVAETERQGIIVDATHLTATALADLLECSTRPFIATPASVMTLGNHAYSFYDEHIIELTRRGGIMGVILYPHVLSNYVDEKSAHRQGSLRDVVRTIRYLVKICGTHRNIGIGSDYGGYISGPHEMQDLGQIELLRRLLHDEFGSHDIVEDIMAGNTIRFLLSHWGKRC